MMEDKTHTIVTVWCLTYNQKDFIKDALDGFVMQKTDFAFEVIVHDDASTDGTTDIVRQYAERYPEIIKPVVETVNQWRKGGLRHIIDIMNEKYRRSKYIAFCEGDDFWTDEFKLQRQVDFLEANPDYSMCFHSARKQYENQSSCWLNCENIENRDYDATSLFVHWTVPTASVICRREAMDFYANIKDKSSIYNYDIFIILSCCMVGKVRGMNEQMSVYRIQGDGLTYNSKALIRCKMQNPEHFLCLKTNFPIVAEKYVNETISKTFFERAIVQNKLSLKIKDYFSSLRFSPCRFFVMSLHTISKSLLSRKK